VEAKEAVRRAATGETGELRLGYVTSAMFTEVLPGVIRRFQKRYPHPAAPARSPLVEQFVRAAQTASWTSASLRRPDMSIPSGVRMEEWYQAPLVAALAQSAPTGGARLAAHTPT